MKMWALWLNVVIFLFLAGCDETNSGDLTTKNIDEVDLTGTWQVHEEGVHTENYALNGVTSVGFPYTSPNWDTTYVLDSLVQKGDSLFVKAWIVTTAKLKIDFKGKAVGSSFTLIGVRTNSYTTPVTTESFVMTGTIVSNEDVRVAISAEMHYQSGSGGIVTGRYGQESDAILTR